MSLFILTLLRLSQWESLGTGFSSLTPPCPSVKCYLVAPDVARSSLVLTLSLIPFGGEQYLETNVWMLHVLIPTRVLQLLSPSISYTGNARMDVHNHMHMCVYNMHAQI